MTKNFKKAVSLFLAVLMVVTMLPVTAIAEEIENLGCTHHPFHTEECGYAEAVEEIPCSHECSEECVEICAHEHDENCGYVPAFEGSECAFYCEKCEADIIYSDENLYFTAEGNLFNEDSESTEITLVRSSAEKETSVTVLIYDNSANYGKDYIFKVNGEPVVQIEGSVSLYDLLRDESETVSALETDANIVYGYANAQQTGVAFEDVSAADMLKMFDDLGVKAAEIPVTFAEGETAVVLDFEVVDDEESEYDEVFLLAVLDEEGEVVETAQQVFGISDNEETPVVTVSFDTEEQVMIDPETGTATLAFKREGNLAESTLSVLYLDNEPLGYINFAPWQKEQTSEVGIAGNYSIYDTEGNLLDEKTITVAYSDSTETKAVEGADPVLDAVPEAYAIIPDTIKSSANYFPDWAKSGNYENETEIVIMGSTSNNLFEKGGRTSKGGVTFFEDKNNHHEIYTSGTGSHYHNGYNFIDSVNSYDFTGIASVESRGKYEGIDYNADFIIGVQDTERTTMRVTKNGTYDISVALPDNFQETKYVYYGNVDPQDDGGGTSLFVPNGFKLNKRPYVFNIDPNYIEPIKFYGDDVHGESGYVPSFDGYTTRSTVYISNIKTVNVSIVYEKDNEFPVKLVGYKLYNEKTKAESKIISLSGNTITFDKNFLKAYEKSYCWKGDANNDGKGDYIFTVVPVFEKIETDYEIIQGEGNLVLQNTNGKLYRGDYAVFKEDTSSGRILAGVYHENFTDVSNVAGSRTTTWADEGTVKIKLDAKTTKHIFEPTYNANATSLYVRYGDNSVSVAGDGTRTPLNGEFNGKEGLYIDKNAYSVNDYITLVADANDGYITKWTAGYETFYGDILYYQLDGIAEHNNIIVDFVPAKDLNIVETDISGTVYYNYVNLESNLSTPVYLDNTSISITGDTYITKDSNGKDVLNGNYSAISDANGKYIISGFKGVSGGKYTVAVPYNNGIGYATITLGNKNTYNVELPQFAAGNSYPYDISVGINGNFNSNMVILTANQNIDITLDVHTPSVDCKPTSVEFYFYASDAEGEKAAEAIKKTITLDAPSRTNEEHTLWDVKIPVSEDLDYTRLYVKIFFEKTVNYFDENGKFVKTESIKMDSGLVDSGYSFINPLVDTTIPIMYDIPETGGVGNVPSVDIKSVHIPFIGNTDVSLSSKTGGYFVTRTDPDTGVTYLICGYSFDSVYATGSIGDKYKMAKEASDKAYQNSLTGSLAPAGSAQANVTATSNETNNTDGDNTGGGNNNNNGSEAKKKKYDLKFAPAFMFKYILDTGDEPGNENKTFIVGYEMMLGLDTYFFTSIPFSVYGIPLYVSFSFSVEGAFQLALKMKNDKIDTAQDLTKLVLGSDTELENEVYESVETMLSFPKLNITGKAGVGYNSFISLFVDMSINIPIMFQFTPKLDVGGKFGFSIHGGVDAVIFSGAFELFGAEFKYGNMDLVDDLVTVQQQQKLLSSSLRTSEKILEESDIPNIEEEFNNVTFSVMRRGSGLRTSATNSNIISQDDFKNTDIQLLELEDGNIAAFYLKDNGEETLNYLSAVYAVSHDRGKTWQTEKFISDNIFEGESSLQYDISIFELEDRILVTWSEADFEKLISEMDIDVDNVTAAQVAKLMAAMNLKGRFMDKETGEFISDTFTIAENSTVACGAIDAVQDGDKVYVYYQRNAIPAKDELSFSDILSIERTIARAKVDVNDVHNWESLPVRVENYEGRQYRIVDIEPFIHDGILGEAIVIDRNGIIASYDSASGSWDPDNEDRQLYLRTYMIDDNGEIENEYIVPVSSTSDNAENPKIVGNDEDVYLFWNQNGKIVYLENFVENAGGPKMEHALVVKESNGTFRKASENEVYETEIASSGTLDPGKEFSVSITDDGTILLSWISDELVYSDGIPTDEIYGVAVKKISNAEAFRLSGIDIGLSGNEDVYQLWALGNPVALTDEDGVITKLDSLCTDEQVGEFLLAFTKLNSELRSSATSADIKAIETVNEPSLEITGIRGESYPRPGEEFNISVKVFNDGFKALDGGKITVNGFGAKTVEFSDIIMPGSEKEFNITVKTPENLAADTDLEVRVNGKGEQENYSAKSVFTVKYDSYFIIADTWQTAVPGTKNDNVEVTVKNIGNAAGSPVIDFRNSIFGVEDEAKNYSFSFNEKVLPDEERTFVCLLEDTYMNEDQTARILITTGEGSDQSVQKFMPKPIEIVTDEDKKEEKPKHEHEWSDWVTEGTRRSRKCSACGIVEYEYIYAGKTEDEYNPETGAVTIVFEKATLFFAKECENGRKKNFLKLSKAALP